MVDIDTRMPGPESGERPSTMPSESFLLPSDMPSEADGVVCGMPLEDAVGTVCEIVSAGEPPDPQRRSDLGAALKGIGMVVSNVCAGACSFLKEAFSMAAEGGGADQRAPAVAPRPAMGAPGMGR